MSIASPVADYRSVETYLAGLKALGVRPGLERMRRLLEALGNPERGVPCIHLAGTNGKGSVAAMLESILRRAGWRTGLYTSPHLVRLGERVQVERRPLPDAEMLAHVRELQPVAARSAPAAKQHPGYFEFMTALAFVHFSRARCDIAVIETGLGGRLDATNVVEPEVSVITSLGIDHAEFLGDSMAAIAAEKAGIIKRGCPVVMARVPSIAEVVVREVATARGAPLVSVRAEFGEDIARYPSTSLAGDHQRWNAATATLAARLLPGRWRVSEDVIAGGLMTVDWPGRWQELVVAGRRLILDAAHNEEGAAALDVALAQLRRECGCVPTFVVGVLGVERARPLLAVVARHAGAIHLVMPEQGRTCSFAELEACMPAAFGGAVTRGAVAEIFPTPGECTLGAPGDVVVVTGSIYLIGEVLARLEPQRGPSESRLQDF